MKSAPVRLNDRVELDLEALVGGGEAIAHLGGYAVFVPRGVPGDRVRARVVSVKPTYARALVEEVLHQGPYRVPALCPLFGTCGGCQWQEVGYEAQLDWKRRLVAEALERIGGFPAGDWILPTLGMADPWYYRNKVHWAIAKQDGKVKIGLYEPRSHRVVDVEHCYIQHPLNNLVLDFLRKTLPQFDFSIYDETTGKGWLRSAFAKVGHRTGELMIGLVTTGSRFPLEEAWVDAVREQFPGVQAIVLNVNPQRGNALLGDETSVLWGRDHLFEGIGDLTFSISARSFFQVNSEQVQRLYDTAVEFAGLHGGERALDLYSGTGTIALYMARHGAREVLGIESIPEAVRDAILNARLNRIANVRFLTGRVEDRLEEVLREGLPDVAVLDPPRKGCDPEVLDALVETGIPRVVYVSCNPATLARDLKRLAEGGYSLRRCQPVDMFPQTAHIETVCELVRWL